MFLAGSPPDINAHYEKSYSSAASLRPISTPITEAIISPRVQPLEIGRAHV